jgi:hypothetical protein
LTVSGEFPVWAQLHHAYGTAEDVPALLQRLEDDPRPKSSPQEEPWFSLWSALCHQGDVYSASYAAVPRLVAIGIGAAGSIDPGFFLLPACIEIARATGRGPVIQPDVLDAYANALAALHQCAFVHAADEWDTAMTQSVAAALAASKGQIELAQALINLDDDIVRRINAFDW